jgi:undecaprenyl-diphosphatase
MQQRTPSISAPSAPSAPPGLLFLAFLLITVIGCIALAVIGFTPPVVMGIVQGLGEFLPISSSAHLILVPWFLGWGDDSIGTLTFDIALHVGTLVAVVAYFWKDWVGLIRAIPAALSGKRPPVGSAEHQLFAVAIGTIPAAIVGVILQDLVESAFRNPLLLAGTLSVMGLALWLVDSRMSQERAINHLTWRDALLIGLAQAAAIVPGFSRSGSTITAARALGFERSAAARFSFLLSVPVTLAAVILKIPDILAIQAHEIPIFAIGVLVSGAVGALSIHFLLGYIRRIGFGIFAFYRFGLAIAILITYFLRQ